MEEGGEGAEEEGKEQEEGREQGETKQSTEEEATTTQAVAEAAACRGCRAGRDKAVQARGQHE